MITRSTMIPCLRYRDAPAMIEWLCSTFRFERHLVVPGKGNEIIHAQLVHHDGMIMIGSANRSEFGRLIKQPGEMNGFETQCAYILVEDADIVYRRAKSAGARIAIEIKDEDYGGRGFSCFDPEGHLWNFGTYNPWQ